MYVYVCTCDRVFVFVCLLIACIDDRFEMHVYRFDAMLKCCMHFVLFTCCIIVVVVVVVVCFWYLFTFFLLISFLNALDICVSCKIFIHQRRLQRMAGKRVCLPLHKMIYLWLALYNPEYTHWKWVEMVNKYFWMWNTLQTAEQIWLSEFQFLPRVKISNKNAILFFEWAIKIIMKK